MTEKKGLGSTVLGWFVVRDEQQPPPPESQADGAAEPAPEETAPLEPVPVFVKEPPPPGGGGEVDFDAVFEAAGIDEEERGRVKRAADLLTALPAGTDAVVKKQIVEASLKAFGVPIDAIIEAGVQEIQALEAYIRSRAAETLKTAEDTQRKVAAFEQEIQRLKAALEEKLAAQQAITRTCNQQKLQVQSVLEFFGQEAVARVVRDSPKLIEPNSTPSP